MSKSPEIEFLINEIIRKFGRSVETSSDFDRLSASIESCTGQTISVSTLKRLWGYVSSNPKPRYSTLNILSQYVGRKDYCQLCLELQDTSEFLNTQRIMASDLVEGTVVVLSWLPDRNVSLEYHGKGKFTVTDSGTSKLEDGDEVEIGEFLKGQPLYVGRILRDGKELPPYVAGKSMGITSITLY